MASHGSLNHSTHSSDHSSRNDSRSNDWRGRANGMVQNGISQAKNNPGMTAAIVGGVAAAAAATVYRDKIGGAISSMRGRSSDTAMQDSPILTGGTLDQGGNMPAHSSMGGSGGPASMM